MRFWKEGGLLIYPGRDGVEAALGQPVFIRMNPAVEVPSLNRRTAREVPRTGFEF